MIISLFIFYIIDYYFIDYYYTKNRKNKNFPFSKIICNKLLIDKIAELSPYSGRTCLGRNVYFKNGEFYLLFQKDNFNYSSDNFTVHLSGMVGHKDGLYNSEIFKNNKPWTPKIKYFNNEQEISIFLDNIIKPVKVFIHSHLYMKSYYSYNMQHLIHDDYYPIFCVLRHFKLLSNNFQTYYYGNLEEKFIPIFKGISNKPEISVYNIGNEVNLFKTLTFGQGEFSGHTPTSDWLVPFYDSRGYWNFRNFYLHNFELNTEFIIQQPKKNNLIITILQKRLYKILNSNELIQMVNDHITNITIREIEWEKGYSWKEEIKIFLESDIIISIHGTIIDSLFLINEGSIYISLGRPSLLNNKKIRATAADFLINSIDYIKILSHYYSWQHIYNHGFYIDSSHLYSTLQYAIKLVNDKFIIPIEKFSNVEYTTKLFQKFINIDKEIFRTFLYFGGAPRLVQCYPCYHEWYNRIKNLKHFFNHDYFFKKHMLECQNRDYCNLLPEKEWNKKQK